MIINTFPGALVLITVIFTIVCIKVFFKMNKNDREMKAMEFQKQLQQEKIKNFSSRKSEILKIIEDIRDDINKGEKLENYENRLAFSTQKYDTGFAALDVLLSYKEMVCEQRNLRFKCEVFNINKTVIEEVDMISLAGNLIDNAIEAAENIEDGFINVRGNVINGIWMLKVVNSKVESHNPLERNMMTSKKDKENHGLGMKIIKNIVNKYDGDIRMEDHSKEFEVLVIMNYKG